MIPADHKKICEADVRREKEFPIPQSKAQSKEGHDTTPDPEITHIS